MTMASLLLKDTYYAPVEVEDLGGKNQLSEAANR